MFKLLTSTGTMSWEHGESNDHTQVPHTHLVTCMHPQVHYVIWFLYAGLCRLSGDCRLVQYHSIMAVSIWWVGPSGDITLLQWLSCCSALLYSAMQYRPEDQADCIVCAHRSTHGRLNICVISKAEQWSMRNAHVLFVISISTFFSSLAQWACIWTNTSVPHSHNCIINIANQ